ncbi:methyltransferase domain-containing protein [Diplogelasinospora grovesii]|uniref:Methyltransferase domain-containing protein n=1 Tax=Diplogelasinospora grovesii TaxID=303347 RepID=A0AAN6N4Q3_9PEZI|nr:methyltransferase domain-containing protein [Diplogelasinospora grovesii]
MLPTPDTSHVPYARVYEPAEDSFLMLDTLGSASEKAFLHMRFAPQNSKMSPLVLEVGSGSGVVIAFLAAYAETIFGTRHVLTCAVDVNKFACTATTETVKRSVEGQDMELGSLTETAMFLGAVQGDLASCVRQGVVDVLVFNPPYVPTEEMPAAEPVQTAFEEDSRLLELAYAGGKDGMETTDRLLEALPDLLSDRGLAYLLLCAGNKPEDVKERIRTLDGGPWRAETVGESGRQAGWEKLQIIRIWRDLPR